MPTVYLAGPISFATWDDATGWRDLVTKRLAKHSIGTLDPLRGKNFLKEFMRSDEIFDEQFSKELQRYDSTGMDHPLTTAKGITKRDRWDVRRCDMLLAYLDKATKPSIGTILEIAWASDADVYTLLVMRPDNPHWHGMVLQTASLVIATLHEAMYLIPTILGVQNETD